MSTCTALAKLNRKEGMPNIRKIPVDLIRADVKAQPREHISTDVVALYADDMAAGAQFPPLIVFKEGNTFWLADGFHRLAAARGAVAKIDCDVRPGTLRDAVLYSCGANAEHGHRRSNEDKRRAVLKLLSDPEWSHWSNHEIARSAKVTAPFVGKLREELSLETVSSEGKRTFRDKHGNISEMAAAAIGPRKQPLSQLLPQARTDYAKPVRHDNGTPAGWMAPILWDVIRLMEQMPDGAAAASSFPVRQRGTLEIVQLEQASEWFAAFASAWRQQEAA